MSRSINLEKAVSAQSDWLDALGLSDDAEVAGTPNRVVKFWVEKLISGYEQDPRIVLGEPLVATSEGVVSLRGIPFHSMCPHHLVPYFGTVDIAYQPSGHILGLGKFEQFVAACSRRLILQEKLNEMLVDILKSHLDARGVIIRINAQHLCFMLDGREPRQTEITTWNASGSLTNAYALFAAGNDDSNGEA